MHGAAPIAMSLSRRVRGPVLSGVMDRQTGKTAFSLNHALPPNNPHPNLAARLSEIGDGDVTKGIPGSHAEVHALNELLWSREAAGLSTAIDDSFIYHNVWLRGRELGNPIPRCANCLFLTNG